MRQRKTTPAQPRIVCPLAWEYENSPNEAKEETLRAIQQGLADADAGRSKPLDEFDREFRRKHGLPPRP